MNSIPTLDFSAFVSGVDSPQRKEFVEGLAGSLSKNGFVKLKNHTVSDDVIRDLFKWTTRFFNLPSEEKEKTAHPPSNDPQRGWSAVGIETTAKLREGNINGSFAIEDCLDAKEHYDIGPPDDDEFPMRWPDESAIPGFREFIEKYFSTCERISIQLMEALEIGLSIAPGTFTGKFTRTASELRLNHYPEIAVSEIKSGRTRRIWPHTDFGIITLLFRDDEGGLELEDRTAPGTFFPVLREAPNEMIVNIGATLQRWTNGVLHAGLHQVTIPHDMKESSQEDAVLPGRYSIAYLFKAEREASAGPLTPFVTAERPAIYDDITALEFQKLRTRDLYRET